MLATFPESQDEECPGPLPSDIEWPVDREKYSGHLAVKPPRRILRRQVFVANLFCGQRRATDV
eukprot:505553-Pyramimonas_sp.AAC.1